MRVDDPLLFAEDMLGDASQNLEIGNIELALASALVALTKETREIKKLIQQRGHPPLDTKKHDTHLSIAVCYSQVYHRRYNVFLQGREIDKIFPRGRGYHITFADDDKMTVHPIGANTKVHLLALGEKD